MAKNTICLWYDKDAEAVLDRRPSPHAALCFPQPDFADRMVGTLAQHDVGPRPRRLNVLPEVGAMMLAP